MEIFAKIIDYLFFIMIPLFFLVIISIIILHQEHTNGFSVFPFKKTSFKLKAALFCVLLTITIFSLLMFFQSIFNKQVINNINNFTNNFCSSGGRVYINDKEINCNQVILKEITHFISIKSHNSKPEEKIKFVLIKGTDTLEITIFRDSQVKDEYWVYYPKYKLTEDNQIGKLKTRLFDSL